MDKESIPIFFSFADMALLLSFFYPIILERVKEKTGTNALFIQQNCPARTLFTFLHLLCVSIGTFIFPPFPLNDI